ncbi:MAG: winged helix-turn-helix domain-containing protein, partial [Burkholderia sp.]
MWDRSTRYGELAFQLQEEICAGPLRPGDKLPSIRALCARFRASSATVTHALYLLEDAGMISVRPRSGFYVRERVD